MISWSRQAEKAQIKRQRQHVLAAMLVLSAALAMTILVKV